MEFKKRINNLEARLCNENLMPPREADKITIEIVQWEKDSCFTIAHFHCNPGGCDLVFCGDGPFGENVNRDNFWLLAEISYKILMTFKEQ